MRQFLQHTKALLSSKPATAAIASTTPLSIPSNNLVFCIGNEAADADSIISSACYSFLQHSQLSSTTTPFRLFVPLVTVTRKELNLRPDVNTLLKVAGMSSQDLLCIDELASPLSQLHQQHSVQYILLDHNALSPTILSNYLSTTFASLDEVDVIEIIDHHRDQLQHLKSCPQHSNQRVIAFDDSLNVPTAGSTCTLIQERLLQDNEGLLRNEEELQTLLLGVICLDTMNMDQSVARGTVRDLKAIDYLTAITAAPRGVTRDELFLKLKNAKMDIDFWDSLSTQDALYLDYKVFSVSFQNKEFGISSVLLPLAQFWQKKDLVATILQYFTTTSSDFLFITTFTDIPGIGPRRELAVISMNEAKQKRFCERLLAHDSEKVEKEKWNFTRQEAPIVQELQSQHRIYLTPFQQDNLQGSRKQLSPMLMTLYDELLSQHPN